MASSSEFEDGIVDVDVDVEDRNVHQEEENANLTTSPEDIIKFIRRIRSLPILYNQDHENFRNYAIKQEAWKEVAEEFGQTQRWCLRKWVSLRDYFVKRKKRLRKGQTLRPWIYYGELSFLNIIYGNDDQDYSNYPPPPPQNGTVTDESNEEGRNLNEESGGIGYLYYGGGQYKGQCQDTKSEDDHDPRVICNEPEDDDIYEIQPPLEVTLDLDEDSDSGESLSFIPPGLRQLQPNLATPPPPKLRRGVFSPSSLPTVTTSRSNRCNFSNISKDCSISVIKQINGVEISSITPPTSGILQSRLQQGTPSRSRKRPFPTATSTSTFNSDPAFNSVTCSDSRSILRLSPGQNPVSTSKRKNYSTNCNKIQSQFEDVEELQEESDSRSSGGGDLSRPLSLTSSSPSTSMSTPRSSPPMDHPYDLFCLSVAAQLKKMRRDKAMLVQIEIMNLLYQTEFSEQDSRN